jgi:glycosyltransferase involved in cell wall biosynthesis
VSRLRVMCLSNMYPGPGAPDYGAFIERMCDALEEEGADVDRVVIRTRSSGALRTPAKYAALGAHAVAAARRADVIWAHYLFPTGLIAAIAGRVTRTPWVVTAHGGDVANLTRTPVRRLSAPGVRGARRVVCVSGWLADRMAEEGLAPSDPAIISMGVDTRRFDLAARGAARARVGVPADAPVVLAVGGLSERKNPVGLMQAFARMRAEGHLQAHLVYVGDGPLAGTLDAEARRLGIAGQVVRTGMLPNAGVTDWMSAADVVAQVSLVEPLGVAALEAMASGRPVVGTTVGGLREVVPDGVAGVIVDPRDQQAIADALARMIDAPPAPGRCREAAMAHSLSHEAALVMDVLRVAAERPA